VDCFPQVSEDGLGFTNNHPDAAVRARYREVWRGFSPSPRRSAAGHHAQPGRFWPGQTPQDDFDRAAEELRWAVARARPAVARTHRAHIESVTWRPELAVAMVSAPDMGLDAYAQPAGRALATAQRSSSARGQSRLAASARPEAARAERDALQLDLRGEGEEAAPHSR